MQTRHTRYSAMISATSRRATKFKFYLQYIATLLAMALMAQRAKLPMCKHCDTWLSLVSVYTDEAGVLMCNVDEIFIKYVSSDWLQFPEKWKPSFKRYIAAKIAYDTMNRFPNTDKNAVIKAHEQRKNDVRAIDAQQSPPQLLTRGNWTRTRTMGGPSRGRP